MKVIAILEHSITGGGGFNQALNAILQMQRICKGQFEIEVFTTQDENAIHLQKFDIPVVTFTYSLVDRFLAKFSLSSVWQLIQSRMKIIGSFEEKLVKRDCDLVYFVTPSSHMLALQKLNYIATVWDVCHRDTPEFPEVRYFNEFFIRERNLNYLSSAIAILVDSEYSADSISFRYKIDHQRLLSMPFVPSPFLDVDLSKSKDDVLKIYKLDTKYFFYPAQFWSHKNHIRILEALLILKRKGGKHTVVFCGGDQGNKNYVKKVVEQNNLDSQVCFLGFVPAEHMRGLYEGCQAVIMPTYFGPTNLPPLEAWMLGKPLIYSAQFSGQVKDAAVLVDPDDASQLAAAITACMDKKFSEKIIKAGRLRLHELTDEHVIAEASLLTRLKIFEKRLRCWE